MWHTWDGIDVANFFYIVLTVKRIFLPAILFDLS